MKIINVFYLLIIFTMIMSCSNSNNPEDWDQKKINHWFKSGEWLGSWEIKPDETINKKEFKNQYFKNPARWKKAFEFLEKNNLDSLKIGRYELDGDNLFVNVDEYITKNEDNCRFEAHKRYADIQYLVYGEEKIGIIALKNTKEIIPYDSIKDISFFSAPQNYYRLANPEKFFVFFPEDAHRPCVKADENIKVRKVVVKVRID